MTDAYQQPRAAAVPDKPVLDGLEAVWSVRWEAESGIPVRPVPAARRGVRDRHAAAHRVRVAARRARVLVHAHRHHGQVPADDRQGGVLPDRLGRQRAADRAAGAERLRGALRPVAALRPGLRTAGREAGRAGKAQRCWSPGGTSSSCASGSPRSTSAPSRRRGAGSGSRWTGRCSTPRSTTTAGACRKRAFLRNLARGEAYRAEAPTLWDVTFQTAVAQAELEDREAPGAFHRISFRAPDGLPGVGRDDAARAAARLRGAGRAPGRRALPAAVRRHGADAGVRRGGAGARAPARRAGQGVGHRDGVHLRRPDRRDLVAGARPADAGDRRTERAAASRGTGRGARRRRTTSWRARPCSRRARGSWSCCGNAATLTASRGPSPGR